MEHSYFTSELTEALMAKIFQTARLKQQIEALCLAGSTNFESEVAVQHLC